VKLIVAAVDVAPAVTVSGPFAEFVFTEAGDDDPQSGVAGVPDTNAWAPTVYATVPVACVYDVPEALKVPTLGFAAGTPRL
jgi:hypothetical protein